METNMAVNMGDKSVYIRPSDLERSVNQQVLKASKVTVCSQTPGPQLFVDLRPGYSIQ